MVTVETAKEVEGRSRYAKKEGTANVQTGHEAKGGCVPHTDLVTQAYQDLMWQDVVYILTATILDSPHLTEIQLSLSYLLGARRGSY